MEAYIGSSDLNLENIITEGVERLVSIRLAIFNTSNTHGRTRLLEDARKVLSVDISGLCMEGSQLLPASNTGPGARNYRDGHRLLVDAAAGDPGHISSA